MDAQTTLATLKRSIWLVSLPFGMLTFVLPVYGQDIGASAIQIGLFFSVFSLMTVLLRPLVGAGLDRFGRRAFYLTGLAGFAVTMFLFAFARDVATIMVARMVQGVSSAFLWLAARAITSDVAGDDVRGREFGAVDQANWQGGMAGAFVGFGVLLLLPFDQGWLWLFLAYGLVSAAATILAWRDLPETFRPAPRAAQRPLQWSRPWALLLLVTAVTGASASMLSPIMLIFLQEQLHADLEALALAYVPAALVWALLPARLGRLADRFGRKPLMVLGLVAAAASSFLIPGLGSIFTLAALWALQALCYAAGDPAEQALVADLTGGDQRGRAFGLYTLAAGLGAMVGPLAGGWLYETYGPMAPFFANGAILALSAVVLWAFLALPSTE